MSTMQYRYIELLGPNIHQGFSISREANVGRLAANPMRGTTGPSAGAALRQAVAVVGARSAIRNGDGTQAAAFFNRELTQTRLKVERVGIGAESQKGGEEGENIGGTHDDCCV